MKKLLLFLTSIITFSEIFAQDSLPTNEISISNFERVRNKSGQLFTESVIDISTIKNLKISESVLIHNNDTLSRALKIDIRGADLKIHLIPYRIIGYLDADEVYAFIKTLKEMLASEKNKPYDNEKNLTFSSRGSLFAGCYVKGYRWRFAISTDPANTDAYTYLNVRQLKQLISTIEEKFALHAKINSPLLQ
jgi:hypothetical protein